MVSENKFNIKYFSVHLLPCLVFRSVDGWMHVYLLILVLYIIVYMYINSYIPLSSSTCLNAFVCQWWTVRHVDYASWDMKSATPLHFLYKWLVWLHTFTTLLAGIDLVWPGDWICWAMKATQKLHALSISIDHCFLGLCANGLKPAICVLVQFIYPG